MAKKKTVADQSRSGHVSSFTGGLNTDLHPMLQPNDTLTDCVNGTLITYNGNENMLQNDMGNYELKHAQLPEGYIPMGMKEHQGVLYIASWNPFEKKAQIGSYPSPKTVFGEENGNDYTINPIEIGDIEGIDELDEKGLAELIFNIAEKNINIDTSKHLVSELDFSSSEVIFTNDFDESTMLGPGDRYWLSSDSTSSYEDEFQNLTYFLIDKDKNKHYITEDITVENAPTDSADINKFNPITFEHSGWLGAKYELKDLEVADVDVTITENPKTSENYGTDIYKVTVGSDETKNLNNVEELWDPDIPAHRVPNALYDIEVNDTYRVLNIDKADAPKTSNTFENLYENPYYKQPIYVLFTPNRVPEILSISLEESSKSTNLEEILIDKLEGCAKIDWLYIPRWYGEINKNQLNFSYLTVDNLIIPGKFTSGISGTITNLYTISDNDILYGADVNTIFLDTSVRKYIAINTNTGSPEFIISDVYDSTKSWNHLEIFGKDPHIGPIPSITDGGIVYMEALIRNLYVDSNISVVVGIDYLKQISSATNATPTIVVIGNEKYTNVKLNLSGNSTLWVTGNVGFTGKLPKNFYSSNVFVPRLGGYTLVLTKNNTCVEKIITTSNEPPAINIPKGIITVSNEIFYDYSYTRLTLPTTLQEIEQRILKEENLSGPVECCAIDNLRIEGNYRLSEGTNIPCNVLNVYVSPNNLSYYKKLDAFKGNPTYHSIYSAGDNVTKYNKFLVDVDFQTDYKILSQVIDSLPNPYIVLPEGIQLSKNNVFYTKIDENKIVANFVEMISDITADDLKYYPSFSSIKIGADCNIKENIVEAGQEWTVTHNSSIDLSKLELGNTVKLNVLGASSEDDLNKFMSNIKFPTFDSLRDDSQLELTIVSAVQIGNPDVSRPGIKITFARDEKYNNYIESNTIEFTVNEDWAAYNFTLSSAGRVNTYTWDVVEIGQVDYEYAWNLALELHGGKSVFENAVLIVPNHAQVEEVVTEWFGAKKIDSNNANSLGNVVLEGPATMQYYKYDYNIASPVSNVDNNTLTIETCLAVNEMFDKPEFGIKLSTPLFKYENDKLYVKNFFASLHRIDKLEFENPTPKANIILSTDTLQENCKVAVRIESDENEPRHCVLNNQLLSQEIVVNKSDSYNITGYTFRQVGTKVLIEDLNTKPFTISKNIVAEDLSIYKYGFIPETRVMRVRLEWPQAIDQSDCYWTVSDLSGNNVANGVPNDVVNVNLFFDNIDLDIDCSNLNDYWYIFSYTTPTKTYKRPLFAKTKVEYNDGSFNGPNYSDYKNAYYDDFVNSEGTAIDYKLEDLPSELSEMQIWHKKRGDHFTWDSQYSKESPKALWWELMDEFSDNEKYYLGTRKYQNVTLDFENFGFVKGVTEYSVELHADGYDKPQIIQSYGVYDENNNKNTFWIPVGESIQEVIEDIDSEQIYPFKKEYLIQNSYSPTEFDCSTILGAEDAIKVSRVCGWDKGKMLCVDKTGGETNDCSIALLDPVEYNPNSDSFKNGKIISGEGNFVSKILSRVDNLFVPIVVRIKTDDNGFVFPVVKNPNWSYKATWDEARGKKNSDNKRSVWSSNGLGAIVHTKNNMAAIMATLISGFALIAAAIAEYVAAIVTAAAGAIASVFTFGTSAVLGAMGSTALFIVAMSQTAAGISLVSAGFAELKKKEKVFKLFALRGKSSKGGQQKDLLVLPLWGKQEEHESKRRHFEGQVRYENVNWSFAEKLMLYLGSRIYARVYSDNSRYIPKFNEENVINNKAFKLTVKFKNIDKKSGGISLKSLEKIFSTIYGIQTNNFKLKVSEIEDVDVNFEGKFDIKNKWIEVLDGESEYSTLDYQIENWCSTDKSGNSVPVVEDMDVDTKIENFVTCLAFDPASRCFYYSEGSDKTWYEEDSRWAFGPNRGGCKMRIKRNFRKKDGEISNDKDWIDVGEFPRFNNDVITPIAYPILPFCENEYTEDTKPNRSENIVNTYIKAPGKGNTPVYMENINLNITKPEDIITKDCMNYLEYIFYDEIQKIQTTDSTN